jgi:biopolymer transport protein ExbD
MPWQVRHEGSPRVVRNLSPQQIVDGMRDGLWEPTDEVQGPGETRWRSIESHPQFEEIAVELEAPRPAHRAEATSLDMNALIDVCLVLLIFFILTTSYANLVQKVVPVPTEKAETKTQVVKTVGAKEIKSKMIRLQVGLDKSGKPLLHIENQPVDAFAKDGKTVDIAKIEAALAPLVRGEDRKKELLMDARGVSWETVVHIQDAARKAGIHTIHYAQVK